jgi:hypothetical protein
MLELPYRGSCFLLQFSYRSCIQSPNNNFKFSKLSAKSLNHPTSLSQLSTIIFLFYVYFKKKVNYTGFNFIYQVFYKISIETL